MLSPLLHRLLALLCHGDGSFVFQTSQESCQLKSRSLEGSSLPDRSRKRSPTNKDDKGWAYIT